MSSFLESKKFNKVHIDNDQEVRNLALAPFINEGGSVFKKTAYFLSSILIGPNKEEKEGMIAYKNGEFKGFNGENWVTFSNTSLWKEGEGVIFTDGTRIGINKINPKKMLEVGGDVAIEKKLFVKDEVTMEGGFQLGENMGKKRKGMVRFWENNFEGYDGEKWIKFGGNEIIPEIKQEVNLESVDKIKLLNCPLTFISKDDDVHFYYDWDRSEFRLEKLHKNFNSIKMEDLSLGNLKINGDIIFQEGGRKTIKNVSDPIVGNDVATKRYVDQMCSGLQNYIVSDFLVLENDALIKEDEIIPNENIGEIEIGNYIFILTKKDSVLVQVEELNPIKYKNISNVSLPAKLCIKSGKYGQSEYIIFNRNNFLQINGMESLDYIGPIAKNGKEIKLIYDEDFYNNDLSIKEKTIGNILLKDNCVHSRNLSESIIESNHIADNVIESRHIGQKVINHSHIQHKSIGDLHLKDGFLKNHHFTPGIISEKELGTECVGMINLKSNIILQKHLTKNSISGENIIEGEIDGKHLNEKLIDSKHLKNNVILSEHLSNKLILSDHLNDFIIGSNHIQEKNISSEHLKPNLIQREHLSVNIITGLHIQENTLTGSHIKDQTITERNLSRKCIMGWHLSDKNIESTHLADNCIDGSKLCEKILEEKHFADACIGTNLLKKNSINSNHIMMNSIDEKHIVNYSIKTTKLIDGCITESKLAENIISTGKIKDHSITNDKIKLPFFKIQTDPVFTCTQVVSLGETLTIGLNQNYMVPKRRDGIVEFLSSVRFGEEGTGQKMQIHMDLDVSSEINISGKLKINGNKIYNIGEIKAFWNKIKPDENFLKYWEKCDGKRVKKTEYSELGDFLGEDDEFYLPDIKGEGIDYYIRIRL